MSDDLDIPILTNIIEPGSTTSAPPKADNFAADDLGLDDLGIDLSAFEQEIPETPPTPVLDINLEHTSEIELDLLNELAEKMAEKMLLEKQQEAANQATTPAATPTANIDPDLASLQNDLAETKPTHNETQSPAEQAAPNTTELNPSTEDDHAPAESTEQAHIHDTAPNIDIDIEEEVEDETPTLIIEPKSVPEPAPEPTSESKAAPTSKSIDRDATNALNLMIDDVLDDVIHEALLKLEFDIKQGIVQRLVENLPDMALEELIRRKK